MKRILITGGAGYIGSHTAKAFAEAGFEPVVYDSLVHGHEWAVKWGPLVRGELADREALSRAFDEYRIDAVAHFAAFINVGESVDNPRKYFENNTLGTLGLLGAMVDAGVNTIVFSSTAAVYGDPERVPIDETHPLRPVNPYGDTKLVVERAIDWYGRAYGLNWAVMRYFNAAGADETAEIGEDHDPETHLIPLAIAAAMNRNAGFRLFGTDYDTTDGTAIRDYIHVSDLADAHVKAVEYLAAGNPSDTFNLGTGTGASIREVLAAIERTGGRSVPATEAPRRAGDPPVLVADAAKARRVLGWTPGRSSLDNIVETAWRWHAR